MNFNLYYKKTAYLLLFIPLLFSGCSKDLGVVEYKLSMNTEVLNPTTDFDLVQMCVLSEQEIFVIGLHDSLETVALYKTVDGGQNWQEISLPMTGIQNVKGFLFLDSQNGALIVNESLYRSQDGGQTWTLAGLSGYTGIKAGTNDFYAFADQYVFDGEVYFFPIGGSRTVAHQFDSDLVYIERSFSAGDKTFFVYTNHFYTSIDGFDFLSEMEFNMPFSPTINAYEEPMDIAFGNGEYVAVHKQGKIIYLNGSTWYNHHTRDYSAIDFRNDFFIAVGDRTISSNYLGKWMDVINLDGLAFQEYFRDVKIIGASSFYVSGNRGLFYKCSFE